MSILQEILEEMAAAGSTGAGSIAANPSADMPIRRREDTHAATKETNWRETAKREALLRSSEKDKLANSVDPSTRERIIAAKKKIQAKKSLMGRIRKYMGLSEAFDMNDVVSRLSDMERRNTEDTVTYGVEDDAGNIMKVTVRREKAAQFEERLSNELANGTPVSPELKRSSTSMAELLFKLKDEFEIVDVEFPEIPSNAVYNSDKIKYGKGDTGGQTDLDNDIDFGSDEENPMGDMGDMGDMGEDGGDDMFGDTEDGEGEDGMPDLNDESDLDFGDEGGAKKPGQDEFADDESVSDFSEPDKGNGGVESLLQGVLAMLKADAEAKKAQAEAETEKARALQAEWSAKAAKASVEQQTELLNMEQDIKSQKLKEKDAKRISDLAKYRVKQTNGMASESLKDKRTLIETVLFEFDEFDTPQTLMRQKVMINQQYRAMPGDDVETLKYKQQARMLAVRELNARIQRAKNKQAYTAQQLAKNANQDPNKVNDPNNKNQDPNNQQNNNDQQNSQQSRFANQEIKSNRFGSLR